MLVLCLALQPIHKFPLLCFFILLLCIFQEQKNVDASLVNSLFKNNMESIIANIKEIPVKELVR